MLKTVSRIAGLAAGGLCLTLVMTVASPATMAQEKPAKPAAPAVAPSSSSAAPAAPAVKADAGQTGQVGGAAMQRLSGVWVEGPGFEVTYGATYDSCAKRCLANARCVMIEFYRPEKKCNLYDAVRPRKKGGSSDVAIRG